VQDEFVLRNKKTIVYKRDNGNRIFLGFLNDFQKNEKQVINRGQKE